jgi:predicted RNA-binding protein YlxR (DUF448 family)
VTASPERQCIGCGRRGPQGDFVRLCVEERWGGEEQDTVKVVVAGRGLSGRGAYLCRKQACLDRALQRRAFQRAFRATVLVDEQEVRKAVRALDIREAKRTGD